MQLSNKLIITAKSQASSSNYKIAQASKKFQIPNPFSLPLLRKYEMEKWLTFNLYCIHISKKRDYCDYFNIHVHYGPNIFLNAHELLNTRLYQQKTPMYFNPKGLVQWFLMHHDIHEILDSKPLASILVPPPWDSFL